jgi:hypothetical protein
LNTVSKKTLDQIHAAIQFNRESYTDERVPRFQKELQDIMKATNMGKNCTLAERVNVAEELDKIRSER